MSKLIFQTRKEKIIAQTLADSIRKLSLARGDVIIVKNYETLKFLSEMPIHLDFVVPLVFAPGGVDKLSREDLLNLLEQVDQRETAQLAPLEVSSVPL